MNPHQTNHTARAVYTPRRLSRSTITLAFVAMSIHAAFAAELKPAVSSWLAAQPNLQTWSAEFVQTRSLKSLAQPLTSSGRVWFQAPNLFRWELGDPVETIAVRAPTELQIIYPRLKRVERYPLSGTQTGPWRDALALLEAGFPRSEAELRDKYNVVSQEISGSKGEVVLQPKAPGARRMMPRIAIAFDTNTAALMSTELQLGDGSLMRNDFTNGVLNPKLKDRLFTPEIPADYKSVEPMRERTGGAKIEDRR